MSLSSLMVNAARCSLVCTLVAMATSAAAMQYVDLSLTSPVTGIQFPALGIPPSSAQVDGTALADMGSDDDGCRHASGGSEYDYTITTDPSSYFSALTVEWDQKSGRFSSPLSNDIREWASRTFNGELQIDLNRTYQLAVATAKARGQQVPERKGFLASQSDIPVEKRYTMALMCYEKRNSPASKRALVALNGAWALRVRMNVPISAPFLAGGFEEVNEQLGKNIKEGEQFQSAKWLKIYKDVFENARLTNEGYLVAGFAYFGLALRDGDKQVCDDILENMTARFKEDEQDQLRGLVRERKRMYAHAPNSQSKISSIPSGSYIQFLQAAANNFIKAIEDESYTRAQLPIRMYVVAECLRRCSQPKYASQAMDWYLALAKLPETQPAMRDTIRAQNRFPSVDAPTALQLGWRADEAIKRLTDSGLVHAPVPTGPDRTLLGAIANDGLGTIDYVSPTWRPMTGGNSQDLIQMLDVISRALLDVAFRTETWPQRLGEVWEQGVIKDRNFVNRFCCPVTGKPLLYEAPKVPIAQLDPKTILVASPEAVPTTQGPRYAACLANLTLVWSAKPLKSGALYVQ